MTKLNALFARSRSGADAVTPILRDLGQLGNRSPQFLRPFIYQLAIIAVLGRVYPIAGVIWLVFTVVCVSLIPLVFAGVVSGLLLLAIGKKIGDIDTALHGFLSRIRGL